MIPGWVLLGLLPMETLPPEDSVATVSVEKLLLADADADLILLVETDPSGGALLRLSDVGYITAAGDTPASTPYRDRVLNAYNIDTRIPPPDLGEPVGGLAFGVIDLESGDEELDSYLSESWEGRDVRVKVGGRYHIDRITEGSLAFAQFQTIQRGTILSVGWSDGRISLAVREKLQELTTPLQTNVYAGTGGLEGDETIKDQRKPLFFGQAFNWEPVLVDASRQIWQWHAGPVQATAAVRDKGVTLPFAGDVADIEAASAPAGGTWISQNTGGYVRLGGVPEGRITIDGSGDKTGGTYVFTVATVAQRLAERVGLTTADFESGAFGGFPTTGTVGIGFRGDPSTALDGISRLMAGVFAWVSQSRTGLLRIGRYLDPEASGPEVTITDDTLTRLEEASENAPVWRVEVEYAVNWTPQDSDALSDALTPQFRDLYSQPFKLSAAEDPAVLTAHPDARVVRLSSHLINEGEADAISAAALAMLKRRARIYRATVERQMFRRVPGGVVRIVSNDSDLAAGRNLLLLSVAEDAASRLNEWELWG